MQKRASPSSLTPFRFPFSNRIGGVPNTLRTEALTLRNNEREKMKGKFLLTLSGSALPWGLSDPCIHSSGAVCTSFRQTQDGSVGKEQQVGALPFEAEISHSSLNFPHGRCVSSRAEGSWRHSDTAKAFIPFYANKALVCMKTNPSPWIPYRN